MVETCDAPGVALPDPSDCPKCGEWRDHPQADCANCGYRPERPMNPDPIAPARGIFHGLLIGAFCWAVILWLVWP